MTDQSRKTLSKPKQILFSVLFILVTLLFCFAILEIGVRVFTKPVYAILQSDEKVGTIHRPNVEEYIWNREAHAEVLTITNDLGYMGERDPREPKGDALRVALIGDSFTEALQVHQYESFPFLLEQTLNVTRENQRPKTEVYNYGVGGTGTFLQLLRYEEHIAPYDMDVVGLVFNHNDFTDNLNKIDFNIETYATESDRNVGLRQFILQFAAPRFVFDQLQGQRWFLEFLDRLGLYELNANLIELMENGRDSLRANPDYYDFTFQLIADLRAKVEAGGSDFFVAIKRVESGFGNDGLYEDNELLKQFLESEGITYFETDIDFQQPVGPAGACLTFGCTGHFTIAGNLQFATFLYEPVSGFLDARLAESIE